MSTNYDQKPLRAIASFKIVDYDQRMVLFGILPDKFDMDLYIYLVDERKCVRNTHSHGRNGLVHSVGRPLHR